MTIIADDNDDAEVIPGVELSWTECDALTMLHIRKDWQGYERPLFRSKWFDYRFIHPAHATYLYTHYWIISYREAFRRNFDARVAEHIKPMKKADLFENDKAFISGLWRGRQHADALCMPYDLYTSLALDRALKYWKQSYMPRPQHLYGAELVQDVAARWEELQEGRLYYGAHAEYRTHHYQGTQAQNDHHEWLLAQAERRANPVPVLQRFFDENLLPVEKIEQRFGAETAMIVQR